jgi:hypothetical protein
MYNSNHILEKKIDILQNTLMHLCKRNNVILHICDYCHTETITQRYDEHRNVAENEITNIHIDIKNGITYSLKKNICDVCKREKK